MHEKRNGDQEGYNKVVIVTSELADRVVGRNGDGIVTYPFLWNDAQSGPRALGVDGKWNCHDKSPEHCCNEIKEGKDLMNMLISCLCISCICYSLYTIIQALPIQIRTAIT